MTREDKYGKGEYEFTITVRECSYRHSAFIVTAVYRQMRRLYLVQQYEYVPVSSQYHAGSIQCPRRFFEIDLELWQTCSMNPCQPECGGYFSSFFLPDMYCFCILFCMFWVLGDPNFRPKIY